MFFNTRLAAASLSRTPPEALLPGDLTLVGNEQVTWLRLATHVPAAHARAESAPAEPAPAELWMLDVQRCGIHDFHRYAHRATAHLAVVGVRYFVQLGSPVRGRPRMGHGSLVSTDEGLLLLVAHPRTRDNFDDHRWLDVATWTLQPAAYELANGPGRPVFEQWELWGVFPGGMHAGQAELVMRGPSKEAPSQDSRH